MTSSEYESQRWQLLLRADADELIGRAALPSARAMLWHTRLRVRRDRQRRTALLFPIAQVTGAALSAVALSVWLWWNAGAARPATHDEAVTLDPYVIALTIACVSIVTLLVAALAVTAMPMDRPRAPSRLSATKP